MMRTLLAELRKIITLRSTYIILGIMVALVLLFAGFIDGYRATAASLASPDMLSGEVTSAVSVTSVLLALVGLLLFAHEYRYNLIMYTLTSTRSRSQVLLAKILAVTLFVVPMVLFVSALSPLAAYAGAHLRGLHMVHQTFNYWDLLWRNVFFAWAYAMFALVFIALIRNQIGAIIVFFIVPGTVEGILSLLLKGNAKYLPFTSLASVLKVGAPGSMSPGHSALVASAYLVVLWIFTWIMFLRRDAN
ncbi:hypothetical protein HJC99_04265 [Candidatus Saccharibacteria bacterium]|nr:hypothetical protein [Candidatus Saccharibacteria bacterium]